MFTPKVNSKQKWGKRHKNTENEVLTDKNARPCSLKRTVQVKTHQTVRPLYQTTKDTRAFLHVKPARNSKFGAVFTYAFVALSSFTFYQNIQVSSIPKIFFQKPHIITHFKKRLNIDFSHEKPVFSKTNQLTRPQHET